MRDLAGKHVIVTGATSGIGRAAALRLAQCGSRLTLVGRDAPRGDAILQQLLDQGAEARLELVDLRAPGAMDGIVRRSVAAYQRIDAAVLAAAATPSPGAMVPIERLEDDAIENELLAELRALALSLRAVLRQLLIQKPVEASIVVVSSINGLGAAPNAALYSASKAAAIALAKAAALEQGRAGVRVNALVPGAFDTPMLAEAMRRQSEGDDLAPVRALYERQIALGRIGKPEEAADAIAWLCSAASSYMTGSSVILDGGLTSAAR